MGNQRMYLWTPVTRGVCLFQTITVVTGSLDNVNNLITSHMVFFHASSHVISIKASPALMRYFPYSPEAVS